MIKAHPVAGNRAVGEAFLADAARPTSGASISTSRPSTTSIRSSARSTPIAAAARSRCWATTSSWAAAASARSSSSPRPSSSSSAAAIPRCGCAAPARRCARWPRRATSAPRAADELIEAYGFLRRVEHRLQMVDDRQTHSLPDDEAGVAAIATFLGYRPIRRLPEGPARPSALRRKPLRAAVRGGAEPGRPRRQPGLHRHRRRSRHARDPGDAWASAIPRRRPASCGAGITAATAPRRRRAPASF